MRARGLVIMAIFALGVIAGVIWARSGKPLMRASWAQQSSSGALASPAVVPAAQPLAPTDEEESIIRVVQQVTPAVVSVRTSEGFGSGVLVRRDGVLLTNAHVVGAARGVTIGLADGRRVPGEVLGRDPTVDVAVVRIPIDGAPVAPLGDSDRLRVGQLAVAIGNPLGLERTVTTGIVSAVNRSPQGFPLEGLIQTDAAISPGNSGGPLLDSRGQVIAINTAIISEPGATGLGFAVPINLAADILQQILTTGRVVRAFLGIQYGELDPTAAERFRLPVREGAIVVQAVPGSPAARAGLQRGDIITAINGTPVRQTGDLRRALRTLRPGQTANLTVQRENQRLSVNVRLAEAPDR